jgi:hypothetical protein
MSLRGWLMATVVAGSMAGASWYVWRAANDRSNQTDSAVVAARPLSTFRPDGAESVTFARQAGARDGSDKSIAMAPFDASSEPRLITQLKCERVHVVSGRGICLESRGAFATSFSAVFFDAAFRRTAELPLVGLPSRAQLSPSGRYAGVTVFVAGHSYLEVGFSTRTSIADAEAGRWLVEDMEKMTVRRDGQVFRRADFNFWGVTFAQDNGTFYATLGTAGKLHLVRGHVGSNDLEIVADDVECPSLSPDNTHIAYKRRVVERIDLIVWRLEVMDLASQARVRLAETRHVDDQVQWLDNQRVLYSLARQGDPIIDTWVVPADGSGAPELFLPMAYSASVLRNRP